MNELDEVLNEFLIESHEELDQLDIDLVALEKAPGDQQLLARIFRCVHTIKGTCGFLDLTKLEAITHVGENLLSLMREGKLVLTSDIATGLLRLVDAIRGILASLESDGTEGSGEYSDLIALLTRLKDGRTEHPSDAAPVSSHGNGDFDLTALGIPGLGPRRAQRIHDELKVHSMSALVDAVRSGKVAALPGFGDALATAILAAVDAAVDAPATTGGDGSPPHDSRDTGRSETGADDADPFDAGDASATAEAEAGTRSSSAADSSIRVDVSLLDGLMNLVGELVLARNQILQHLTQQDAGDLHGTSQRLNLITTELQESVMKTRMQPIGNIWSKYPRVVRDLATACGKNVSIRMEGQDTELDKTLIEAIKDPLTHIVRNSIDHGIEDPETRAAAGKPAEGSLFLRAYHEGGQVNIEISDDGGGINLQRVREKALSVGILTPEQTSQMSERALAGLIFEPGFSTAAKVTNVSGRGVGMDVVKTNIERISGTIDVITNLGRGTTIKIKIPLTLAIIPALVVSAAGDRYAIPQVHLLELVRLDGEDALSAVSTVRGAPVYRLRGNLLPLVYLDQALRVATRSDQESIDEGGATNIVVLQAGEKRFGLVVDDINDSEEIVVKPISKQLKNIDALAGATIMGDGTVALILDILGLAQQARVITERSDVQDRTAADVAIADVGPSNRQSLLLTELGNRRRLGIPLTQVTRLEKFPADTLERADGREVVQYRGDIMPLIRLDTVFSNGADPEVASNGANDSLQVVVYSNESSTVGIVVDNILDILEDEVVIQRQSTTFGIDGSATIDGRVTDMLDIEAVVSRC